MRNGFNKKRFVFLTLGSKLALQTYFWQQIYIIKNNNTVKYQNINKLIILNTY